jgi:hypothetical protein
VLQAVLEDDPNESAHMFGKLLAFQSEFAEGVIVRDSPQTVDGIE